MAGAGGGAQQRRPSTDFQCCGMRSCGGWCRWPLAAHSCPPQPPLRCPPHPAHPAQAPTHLEVVERAELEGSPGVLVVEHRLLLGKVVAARGAGEGGGEGRDQQEGRRTLTAARCQHARVRAPWQPRFWEASGWGTPGRTLPAHSAGKAGGRACLLLTCRPACSPCPPSTSPAPQRQQRQRQQRQQQQQQRQQLGVLPA